MARSIPQKLATICLLPFCLGFSDQARSQSVPDAVWTTLLDQWRVVGDKPAIQPRPRSKASQQDPIPFRKHGAIVYHRGDDFRLTLDVYQPEGSGPFPGILAVHGGAWRTGSKFSMIRHAWKLAAAGYVVVAINYRHAPKFPFPAQIQDCRHAVRWMRLNADRYCIDSDNIAAFGYSAGGHLVSLLGTSDGSARLDGEITDDRMKHLSSRVQAVIAGGAVCEFSWIDPDSRMLSYWLGGSPSDVPEIYAEANPASHVSDDDPPFFFYHGDADLVVPISSSRKLHNLLLQHGVSSEHYPVPGKGHIGTYSDVTWLNHAIDFLDRCFDDAEPTGSDGSQSQNPLCSSKNDR